MHFFNYCHDNSVDGDYDLRIRHASRLLHPAALQVFNRGQTGGPYWYSHGWNLPGVAAWSISSAIALTTVNIPDHFVGWFGHLASGVDISVLVALVLPSFLYPVFLFLYPDPEGVFGQAGPRLVPAADRPVEPVIDTR